MIAWLSGTDHAYPEGVLIAASQAPAPPPPATARHGPGGRGLPRRGAAWLSPSPPGQRRPCRPSQGLTMATRHNTPPCLGMQIYGKSNKNLLG